jgi:hypothetical protein
MKRTAFVASILATVALAGCDLQTERWDYSVTRPVEIKKVVATVDVGDVTIRTDSDTVHVEAEARWIGEQPEVTFRPIGDTLYVTASCDDRDPQCRVDLALVIPPDAALEAHGGETNIDAEGLGGALDLTIDEGWIRGDDLLSSVVTASVADGSTSLTFRDGADDVAVESGAGDVLLVVPPTSYSLDAVADGTLDIGVGTSNAAKRQITVHVDHGDVVIRPQLIFLGEPFELKFGETAQMVDDRVSVTFDGVVEDSRCPLDVQCVWAGRFIAALSAALPDGTRQAFELQLGASEGVLGYDIALHEVLPPRTEGTTPSDDSYALTLTVDPAR